MTWPDVQKPHWKASASINACCTGSSVPSRASPSTVVTWRPVQSTASNKHAYIARPSTRTVQAPQSPMSHTFFVPVRWSAERRVSRSVRRGSSTSRCSAPLMSKVTGWSVVCTGWSVVCIGPILFMFGGPPGLRPSLSALDAERGCRTPARCRAVRRRTLGPHSHIGRRRGIRYQFENPAHRATARWEPLARPGIATTSPQAGIPHA
jgi:hypothetical protein